MGAVPPGFSVCKTPDDKAPRMQKTGKYDEQTAVCQWPDAEAQSEILLEIVDDSVSCSFHVGVGYGIAIRPRQVS